MGAASYLQTSFLGGEWSTYAQGRADKETYRSALNVCRNSFPIEEGAWTRRPGFWHAAPTRKGVPGKLLEVEFTETLPYNVELSDGHMRFFSGQEIVLESNWQFVTGFSTANPSQVTLPHPHGYATGDEVGFFFSAPLILGTDGDGIWWVWNRQFEIVVTGDYTFTVHDPITGVGLDGSTIALQGNVVSCARVLDFATPWTGTLWQDVILTQDEDVALMMHPTVPTQSLSINAVPNIITGAPAGFSFAPSNFQDGPYLDPPTDASTLTPSATSGVITVTLGINGYDSGTVYGIGDVVADGGVTYTSLQDANAGHTPSTSGAFWSTNIGKTTSVNSGQGFLSTDVGRQVRMFSEPADWDSSTAYTTGQTVKYAGSYWSAIANNTNKEPDTQITDWAISTTAAVWTWGTITSVSGGVPTVQLKGGSLLYDLPVKIYQIGVYSDTTGYPAAGTFLGGRFWLMSPAIGNRLDSTEANNGLVFSPTAPDGTVEDDNGISAVLQATDVNTLFWAISDHNGLVVGSQGGEWAIQASNNNDPITPTSIQAHRVTRYGAAKIQPVRAGLSVAFVQKYGRKLYEYIADVYSGKYSGTNLSLMAKHLSAPIIEEIAYQQELLPAIWARCSDGSLIGCTYKRESPFGTQPASFSGWHRHDLGDNRTIESIQGGPAIGGNLDTIATVSADPSELVRWVSLLSTMFDEDTDLLNANFLDSSRVPAYAQLLSDASGIRFFGYYYLAGQSGISVFAGGLDMGDFTVSSTGTIDVPFTTLFTPAYMEELTVTVADFPTFDVIVDGGQVTGPLDPELGSISWFDITGAAGQNGGFAYADYDGGTVIIQGGGTGGQGASLVEYPITGQLWTREKTSTQIVGDTDSTSGIGGNFAVSRDGYIYMGWNYESLATGVVYKITKDEWDLVGYLGDPYDGTGGAHSGNWIPGSGGIGNSIPLGGPCCAVDTGFNSWFLSISSVEQEVPGITLTLTTQPATPASAPMTTPFAIWHWLDPERQVRAYPVEGPTGTHLGVGVGTAFVLGSPTNNAGLQSPNHCNFSRLSVHSTALTTNALSPYDGTGNGGISLDPIKHIAPSDIATGWTHFDYVTGCLLDELDGNIICNITTNTCPTWAGSTGYGGGAMVAYLGHDYVNISNATSTGDNPATSPSVWSDCGVNTGYSDVSYLVKLSTVDGSVIWKITMPSLATLGYFTFSQSRCRKGRFDFGLDGVPTTFCRVNTTLGTLDTSITILGTSVNSGTSIYDDKTGTWLNQLISYADIGGAPVPIGSTPGTFTFHWTVFSNVPTTLATYHIPCVAGYTYTSQGQLLRPIAPQETGARNGPALGKTRRTHQFAALLANTISGCISFGSDFTKMHAAKLTSPGGKEFTPLQMWTGTFEEVLENDYDFDSMPAWQITRPLPATVLAFEAFLHTQDR